LGDELERCLRGLDGPFGVVLVFGGGVVLVVVLGGDVVVVVVVEVDPEVVVEVVVGVVVVVLVTTAVHGLGTTEVIGDESGAPETRTAFAPSASSAAPLVGSGGGTGTL
jgi:hypothetical protein